VAVKDVVDVAGVPTEAGSRVALGRAPAEDATAVVRLREAGAVLVGKTVTHEFAWGVNAPVTRSPWRDGCYPGGSSAGSGVAVAVRSAFAAIGTDTGGSIRIPASVNGIVGLKPTYGRVSRTGVLPLSWSLDHVGPLTRTVEDNAILLQALAGHDPADLASIDEPVGDYRAGLGAGAAGAVLGVVRQHSLDYRSTRADVRAAAEAAIAEYERIGARVVEVRLPELDLAPQTALTIALAEASAFHRTLLREHAEAYAEETRLMLQLGELVPATHYVTALRARTLFQARVREAFRAHALDAVIGPTVPLPTVPTETRLRPLESGDAPFTAYVHHTFPANLLGLPALSIPCGFTDDGLPVGLELLGRPFGEATLYRLARAYEREHDWADAVPPALTAEARS
jgi:Asp-tRNA(Asn)/Glu-tRNA(Gln) amidotransferase A subunit family amidase